LDVSIAASTDAGLTPSTARVPSVVVDAEAADESPVAVGWFDVTLSGFEPTSFAVLIAPKASEADMPPTVSEPWF